MTNITAEHRAAFEALVSGDFENFAPSISCIGSSRSASRPPHRRPRVRTSIRRPCAIFGRRFLLVPLSFRLTTSRCRLLIVRATDHGIRIMDQHHKRAHEGAFYRDLGHNLRLTRCAAGKTQTEIADHLDITYQQIQKYEAGTNRIPLDRMVRLAPLPGRE